MFGRSCLERLEVDLGMEKRMLKCGGGKKEVEAGRCDEVCL